ncbi:hypothetical protein [Rhizobium herbae]|jgi:hypothetical protein|uniref:Uncharacterized protein n=1 Tax=Rhizobium herbae TaxID=508661 RepID=A0ABS4EUC5_9HYPH|nr:hypothetical protein [Rhizobium herbae]MBP1861549.1 hypothetical protein [Rhizobium herbae]
MSALDLFNNRNFPPFAFGRQIDETDAVLADYVAIGKLIVEWAKNPQSAPTTMAELRSKVGAFMTIDAKYTRFRIEQADSDTAEGLEFVLRLPPAGQVAESEGRVASASPGQDYPLPNLYADLAGNDVPLDAFYGRVADYTMRSCR